MWVKNRSQFYESFLKNYNEDSNKRHFLKFNVKYSEKIHEIFNGLPFLTERMKSGGAEELLSNFYDEKEYVVHIRTFKEVLIYGLLLIKVHRVNKINQKAWLKSCIDMNMELKQNVKNGVERDFFKLLNNIVFEITMENVRKH